MSYIKLYGVQSNAHTRDARKGATRATWFELSVCPYHTHVTDELYTNGLYDMSVTGLYVIFIGVFTLDVLGLHKFSITGLKILPANVHPCDVRDSMDLTSKSGLPGLNGLTPESALNVLNGINGLVKKIGPGKISFTTCLTNLLISTQRIYR